MKGKIVMDEDVPLRDPNMLNLVAEVSTRAPPPPPPFCPRSHPRCRGSRIFRECQQANLHRLDFSAFHLRGTCACGGGAGRPRRTAAGTCTYWPSTAGSSTTSSAPSSPRASRSPLSHRAHCIRGRRVGPRSPRVTDVRAAGVRAWGRQLTVVPWNWDIKKERYDGLFISNGPGDPAMCEETVNNLRWAIEQATPPPPPSDPLRPRSVQLLRRWERAVLLRGTERAGRRRLW